MGCLRLFLFCLLLSKNNFEIQLLAPPLLVVLYDLSKATRCFCLSFCFSELFLFSREEYRAASCLVSAATLTLRTVKLCWGGLGLEPSSSFLEYFWRSLPSRPSGQSKGVFFETSPRTSFLLGRNNFSDLALARGVGGRSTPSSSSTPSWFAKTASSSALTSVSGVWLVSVSAGAVPVGVVGGSSSLESFLLTNDFSDPSRRRCSRRSRSHEILDLCQSTTDELRNREDASERDRGLRAPASGVGLINHFTHVSYIYSWSGASFKDVINLVVRGLRVPWGHRSRLWIL